MRSIDADAFLKYEIKRCDGEMPYVGTCWGDSDGCNETEPRGRRGKRGGNRMTISKKAQMISCMAEELAENVSIYETARDSHDYRPFYGCGGIGQQQSRTGLKRQIQMIRAELLDLDKRING